jgi:hypothetical protein
MDHLLCREVAVADQDDVHNLEVAEVKLVTEDSLYE